MCPEITAPGPLLLREVPKMRIVFLDADDVRIRFEAACFPIEQLWGPAVPVEMLCDEAHAAWTDQHPRVLRES